MEQLLEQEPRLQGLFCVTDVLATGALFECMRRGWPVPHRLGVMGFGNYEIAAEVPPGLTTVHTPGDKIGKAAANIIVSRVEGLPSAEPLIDVGYSLVVRASV